MFVIIFELSPIYFSKFESTIKISIKFFGKITEFIQSFNVFLIDFNKEGRYKFC